MYWQQKNVFFKFYSWEWRSHVFPHKLNPASQSDRKLLTLSPPIHTYTHIYTFSRNWWEAFWYTWDLCRTSLSKSRFWRYFNNFHFHNYMKYSMVHEIKIRSYTGHILKGNTEDSPQLKWILAKRPFFYWKYSKKLGIILIYLKFYGPFSK